MEPSGCNRWQAVANRNGAKTAKSSHNRGRRLQKASKWPFLLRCRDTTHS